MAYIDKSLSSILVFYGIPVAAAESLKTPIQSLASDTWNCIEILPDVSGILPI